MRLDAQHFTALKAALFDAFTSVAAVEELVLRACGQSLDQVARGGDTGEILTKVIIRAQDEGWLQDLVEAALALRPGNAQISAVSQELRPVLLDGADPYETLCLWGGQVLVDRQPLREAVKELRSAEGRRILVVDGPPMSGKTYSRNYISHLASIMGGFRTICVDLERLAVAGRVAPDVLAKSIASQMRLGKTPQHPWWKGMLLAWTVHWNREFCDWLTGELAEREVNYWLVLDSFNRVRFLPQGTRDLIYELASRIETHWHWMRLILLGYKEHDLLPRQVQGRLYEPLQRINEEEVRRFFVRFYEERQQHDNQPYLETDIEDSMRRVLSTINFDDDESLWMVGEAVCREVRDLKFGR